MKQACCTIIELQCRPGSRGVSYKVELITAAQSLRREIIVLYLFFSVLYEYLGNWFQKGDIGARQMRVLLGGIHGEKNAFGF
jgi:hypothetical protein